MGEGGLKIFMKKLASVAEEGVRVEEDAGCHAARRPGAGPRPGSFLMVVHSIFIFVLSFFSFYICSTRFLDKRPGSWNNR